MERKQEEVKHKITRVLRWATVLGVGGPFLLAVTAIIIATRNQELFVWCFIGVVVLMITGVWINHRSFLPFLKKLVKERERYGTYLAHFKSDARNLINPLEVRSLADSGVVYPTMVPVGEDNTSLRLNVLAGNVKFAEEQFDQTRKLKNRMRDLLMVQAEQINHHANTLGTAWEGALAFGVVKPSDKGRFFKEKVVEEEA